jgi:hypothetical protein
MTKYKCSETISKVKCCVICGQSEWFCLCPQHKLIVSITNSTTTIIANESSKTTSIVDKNTKTTSIADENAKTTSIADENAKTTVLPEKPFQKEVFEHNPTERPVCVQKTISKEIETRPSLSQNICFSTEVFSSISSEEDYWECNCGTQLKHNEECMYCRQC